MARTLLNTITAGGGGGGGGTGLTNTPVAVGGNAVSGRRYLTNSSAGAFNMQMPAGGTGSSFHFTDSANTWSTKPVGLLPSTGQRFQGQLPDEPFYLDVSNSSADVNWDTANLWWVVEGPGISTSPYTSSALADDVAFVPTILGNTSNPTLTYTVRNGVYSREGQFMELRVQINTNVWSVAGSGPVEIALPPGFTIDTTNLSLNSYSSTLGQGIFYDASVPASYIVNVYASSSTRLQFARDGGISLQTTDLANSDQLGFTVRIPIVGWSSNQYQAQASMSESASNSSNADASDTSSFVSGDDGSSTPSINLTAARFRRVRFSSPHQAGDVFVIEVKQSTNPWFNINDAAYRSGISPFIYQNAVTYGIGVDTAPSNAGTGEVDVIFGQYYYSSAGYGGIGSQWSTLANMRWRIRRVRAGSVAGFNKATSTELGLTQGGFVPGSVSPLPIPAGNIGEIITILGGGNGGSLSIPTSGTNFNISSISLPAGKWEVSAHLYCYSGGTTNWSFVNAGVSLASAAFDSASLGGVIQTFNLQAICPVSQAYLQSCGSRFFEFTTTTTVYFVAGFQYSSIGGAGISTGSKMTAKRVG